MEGKLKIIILVLVIFLVANLFMVLGLQHSKTALMREYNATKQKLLGENQMLVEKINSVLSQNRSLEDRLGLLKSDLEQISTERKKMHHDYELIKSERQELLRKYARLEENFGSLEDKEKTMQEEIVVLEKQNSELQAELNELRDTNVSLKKEIKEAKQVIQQKEEDMVVAAARQKKADVERVSEVSSVDLPTIVVSPSAYMDTALYSSLQGKIINVNRRYNFVVINLGSQAGIKEGMIFEVFRGDKPLGKVEVIQLRQKIAACDIIQANLALEIDDIVRY